MTPSERGKPRGQRVVAYESRQRRAPGGHCDKRLRFAAPDVDGATRSSRNQGTIATPHGLSPAATRAVTAPRATSTIETSLEGPLAV